MGRNTVHPRHRQSHTLCPQLGHPLMHHCPHWRQQRVNVKHTSFVIIQKSKIAHPLFFFFLMIYFCSNCMFCVFVLWLIWCTGCTSTCYERCNIGKGKRECQRACTRCCKQCSCVPPGPPGTNLEKCGKCYSEVTYHGQIYKCPWNGLLFLIIAGSIN